MRLIGGGFIGVIEEWFISRLNRAMFFTLAGRNLEFVMIKDMSVMVGKKPVGQIDRAQLDGRTDALSANLGQLLRKSWMT